MKLLKNIFTLSLVGTFLTQSAVANSTRCDDQQSCVEEYRANTATILIGGGALVAIGIALANQQSSDSIPSSKISNQTSFMRTSLPNTKGDFGRGFNKLRNINDNNPMNFIGYKTDIIGKNIQFYQNINFDTITPISDDNYIMSNIYTSAIKTGLSWHDLRFEFIILDTITYGNMSTNTPFNNDIENQKTYNQMNIDLTNRPVIEYNIKYKSFYIGYINNHDIKDEAYIMAKTKINF